MIPRCRREPLVRALSRADRPCICYGRELYNLQDSDEGDHGIGPAAPIVRVHERVDRTVQQKAQLLRPREVGHKAEEPEGRGVVILVQELGGVPAQPDYERGVGPLPQFWQGERQREGADPRPLHWFAKESVPVEQLPPALEPHRRGEAAEGGI